MLFKNISYLELWQPFLSAERNHLCNFGRGSYEEQFCEIILSLSQWFRRCRLKKKPFWSSGSPPVRWRGTIYAILKEGIIGNIYVKLSKIWTSGSGDVVYAKWTAGRRTKTDHNSSHLEPLAQVS